MSDNQNKAHILIADDEPLVRDILSRRLTGAGYQCTEALDGLDAIEKLKVANIDLMLLDISMPKKSGIEVLHNIINIYPDLAVIMVTAIGNVDMAIDAMKKGAYDYIIKPVDQKILMPSIVKALERKLQRLFY